MEVFADLVDWAHFSVIEFSAKVSKFAFPRNPKKMPQKKEKKFK
jgi:hypothetical protein